MSLTSVEILRRWRDNPVLFVREVIGVEPDKWQADVLMAFPKSPRMAMKACKGPGKTAVLAWIAWNFLVTRKNAKIAATSITSDNLADGLWTEMALWQSKSELLKAAFTWNKTRIVANEDGAFWYMSARTWAKGGSSEQQSNTLAGIHADNLLFVIDEVGGIPDAVMAAAEAGLANAGLKGLEAHIVIAGNPTHLEGPLYRACTTERDMWHVTEITSDPDDPKRTPRVSVQWARDQIKKYGRDNPWVLVNVFGKFPPSSLNSLLGPDDVRAAMDRSLTYNTQELDGMARIIGVDVAREGADQSCIVKRQGRFVHKPISKRNIGSIEGAGIVASEWRDWQADACFIDNTGGFGGGWLDQLRELGRRPIGIHFAGKADDPRYFNKRAEMWFRMAEWIKEGGVLPDVPELVGELTVPTYGFKGDRLILEDKDQIKAKLGRSPDVADSLALTFAQHVHAPSNRLRGRAVPKSRKSFDPFA